MFKVMMFTSSLLPMYICLIIKYNNFSQKPVSFIIACTLILLGILATIFVLVFSSSSKRGKVLKVGRLTPVKQVSANYLMAYVLPFIVFDFDKNGDILIFFIIYALLMLLYVKYNLTYFNLVLEILGFIVCSAQLESEEQEAIIILKNIKHSQKENLLLEKIGNGLYIHIHDKKRKKVF